jgi:hypothetical protein
MPKLGPLFNPPPKKLKTLTPNGGNVVDSYGNHPVDDRYNPDKTLPRDPVRKPK